MLTANPIAIGSWFVFITTGIVRVILRTASAAGAEPATITAGIKTTNSTARSGQARNCSLGEPQLIGDVPAFQITEIMRILPAIRMIGQPLFDDSCADWIADSGKNNRYGRGCSL